MSITATLTQKFKFDIAVRIFAAVSGVVLIVFLARFLGTDNYGLLYLSIAVFGIVRLFSTLGIAKAAARYVSEYKETDPGQVPHIVRVSLLINLIVILVVVPGFLLLTGTVATVLSEPELESYLLLAVFFVPLATLVQYARVMLQGFEDIRSAAGVKLVNALGRVVFVFLFVLLGFEVVGALAGYVVGYLFAVLVGLGILYSKRQSIEAVTPEPGLTRRILEYNVPIALTHSAHTIEHRIDTVLVGFFLNPIAVAYYTLGKQIIQFIEVPMAALGFTISPTFSAEKAKGNVDTASAVYETALSNSLLLYLPAITGLILVSEPMIEIVFGQEFLGAVPVVRVLALSGILIAITHVTAQGLDYLGRARERSIAKLTTALLNILLNILLIPRFGVVGAAYATVVTFALYTLFNLYIIDTELEIRWRWLANRMGYAVFVTGVMAAVLFPTLQYVTGILTLAGVVVLGVFVWAVQALYFGLIDPETVRAHV